jgi:hypothetical protein
LKSGLVIGYKLVRRIFETKKTLKIDRISGYLTTLVQVNMIYNVEWVIRQDTELLGFWAFSIVRNSREYKTRRFGNWICFRPQVKGEKTPTQLGPLERANLNHWTIT